MKLLTTKKREHRPDPYPCWIVYEKVTLYLLGLIPIKSTLKKIK